jgi:hypothetical protein
MDGIVGSLRLGWNALLLKTEAYETMRDVADPVIKGIILIIVVGVIIALFGLVGSALEWATTPDLGEIQETVFSYLREMPWWDEVTQADPKFASQFEQSWDTAWQIFPTIGGAANVAGSALGIITTPLALLIRWFIYGLLAYLFARWLGGTGSLSETLGVLALAVAPQALSILTVIPYVELGSLVAIWGVLCAYVGLRTAHKLSWDRAIWATLLPFLSVLALLFLLGCLGTSIFAAVVKGGS